MARDWSLHRARFSNGLPAWNWPAGARM